MLQLANQVLQVSDVEEIARATCCGTWCQRLEELRHKSCSWGMSAIALASSAKRQKRISGRLIIVSTVRS